MGADLYLNPPREIRRASEVVAGMEVQLKELGREVSRLQRVIGAKDKELEALRLALKSVGGGNG